MTEEKIIAVGLLTQRDLDRLGSGFQRLYPVPHDDAFAGLLRQLEHVEPSPCQTS